MEFCCDFARQNCSRLCEALIGNNNTPYSQSPNTFVGPFGFFPEEIEILEGNPNLKPEIARTWTLGTVLHSPFDSAALSKLTASLDWYNIDISGLIAPQDPVTTYADCLNANGVSNPTYSVTNPACELIQRDPITGDRHSVDAPYVNTGGLKTSGLDVQINWRAPFTDRVTRRSSRLRAARCKGQSRTAYSHCRRAGSSTTPCRCAQASTICSTRSQ